MAAVAIPPELVPHALSLPAKPNAPIHYTYVAPSDATSSTLVVFLNGLMMPQAGWHPAIALLLRQRKLAASAWPAMMTYDRYGQGQTSARDPADGLPGKEPGHGHDVADVVTDLHVLIKEVCRERGGHPPSRLVLIANSIGCAIARLYAERFVGAPNVSAILMLDSIMANSDFVSMFPNPDSPSFPGPSSLPDGVTEEEVRDTRLKYGKMFHPSVVNAEGLSRRNLAELLPHSNTPILKSGDLDGKGPLLLVVGHDPEWFAKEGEEGSMHTPQAVTMSYVNPAWQRYNEGLVAITNRDRYLATEKVPLIAPKCGHFIQRDDPLFVAGLVDKILNAVDATFDS
ncbi:hypothetical protein FH972_023832 [Carpinus fangiana]|uniref:AB hydrolase-1 domain-containing protein n=1 Tax=Carpinus fangiana TaxID=176857 RepID=A0A5N6KWZ6_9ROSI|nr:hypothetical protein FH972_023832 [Carpinus fangiana]